MWLSELGKVLRIVTPGPKWCNHLARSNSGQVHVRN